MWPTAFFVAFFFFYACKRHNFTYDFSLFEFGLMQAAIIRETVLHKHKNATCSAKWQAKFAKSWWGKHLAICDPAKTLETKTEFLFASILWSNNVSILCLDLLLSKLNHASLSWLPTDSHCKFCILIGWKVWFDFYWLCSIMLVYREKQGTRCRGPKRRSWRLSCWSSMILMQTNTNK